MESFVSGDALTLSQIYKYLHPKYFPIVLHISYQHISKHRAGAYWAEEEGKIYNGSVASQKNTKVDARQATRRATAHARSHSLRQDSYTLLTFTC